MVVELVQLGGTQFKSAIIMISVDIVEQVSKEALNLFERISFFFLTSD